MRKSKKEENIDQFLEDATWEARFTKFLDEYKKEGLNEFYEK